MKYIYCTLLPIVLSLLACKEEESPNPIYLHENGVTVVAHEWAEIGDIGTLNGHVYKIVDRAELKQAVSERKEVKYACTTRVTDMYGLFTNLNSNNNYYTNETDYSPDISSWDVSNVDDMRQMFYGSKYNPDLSNWDVAKVKYMSQMFRNSTFNSDLSSWDVSNVLNMSQMFAGSIVPDSLLNADPFYEEFHSPNPFNQDLSKWNVSKVINMSWMFQDNLSFNQDLSSWNVDEVLECNGFDHGTIQWILPKPDFSNCSSD